MVFAVVQVSCIWRTFENRHVVINFDGWMENDDDIMKVFLEAWRNKDGVIRICVETIKAILKAGSQMQQDEKSTGVRRRQKRSAAAYPDAFVGHITRTFHPSGINNACNYCFEPRENVLSTRVDAFVGC